MGRGNGSGRETVSSSSFTINILFALGVSTDADVHDDSGTDGESHSSLSLKRWESFRFLSKTSSGELGDVHEGWLDEHGV